MLQYVNKCLHCDQIVLTVRTSEFMLELFYLLLELLRLPVEGVHLVRTLLLELHIQLGLKQLAGKHLVHTEVKSLQSHTRKCIYVKKCVSKF